MFCGKKAVDGFVSLVNSTMEASDLVDIIHEVFRSDGDSDHISDN